MAKRAQQESGEERVTAKSRFVMNLTARMPSFVSCSISSNLVRTSSGYRDPGKSVASDDRSGILVNRQDQIIHKRITVDLGLLKRGKVELRSPVDRGNLRKFLGMHCKKLTLIVRNLAHSARYGELIHDRTGKPLSVHHQEQAYSENFVMGSDAAEFSNKVQDQVRNRQKRMSHVAESSDEHSIIWRMFMATTLNAATFMGKNFSTIQSVGKNYESHFETVVRCHSAVGEQSGRNQLPGQNTVGNVIN